MVMKVNSLLIRPVRRIINLINVMEDKKKKKIYIIFVYKQLFNYLFDNSFIIFPAITSFCISDVPS